MNTETNNYDVDYFINKFEAIPENKWTTGAWMRKRKNDPETRYCALGHCGEKGADSCTIEGRYLRKLVKTQLNRFIIDINDCPHAGVGKTPKERVLNALREIKEKMMKKSNKNGFKIKVEKEEEEVEKMVKINV